MSYNVFKEIDVSVKWMLDICSTGTMLVRLFPNWVSGY